MSAAVAHHSSCRVTSTSFVHLDTDHKGKRLHTTFDHLLARESLPLECRRARSTPTLPVRFNIVRALPDEILILGLVAILPSAHLQNDSAIRTTDVDTVHWPFSLNSSQRYSLQYSQSPLDLILKALDTKYENSHGSEGHLASTIWRPVSTISSVVERHRSEPSTRGNSNPGSFSSQRQVTAESRSVLLISPRLCEYRGNSQSDRCALFRFSVWGEEADHAAILPLDVGAGQFGVDTGEASEDSDNGGAHVVRLWSVWKATDRPWPHPIPLMSSATAWSTRQ